MISITILEPPEPIDCEWTTWRTVNGKEVDYGCSKSCGGGDRLMERSYAELARNGGKNCSGEKTMYEKCNEQDCPTTTQPTTTTTTVPTTTTKYRFIWGQDKTIQEEETPGCKNCKNFNPFALLSAILFF